MPKKNPHKRLSFNDMVAQRRAEAVQNSLLKPTKEDARRKINALEQLGQDEHITVNLREVSDILVYSGAFDCLEALSKAVAAEAKIMFSVMAPKEMRIRTCLMGVHNASSNDKKDIIKAIVKVARNVLDTGVAQQQAAPGRQTVPERFPMMV